MNIKTNQNRTPGNNQASATTKLKVASQRSVGEQKIEGAINALKDNQKDIHIILQADKNLNERKISYGPFGGTDIALLIALKCPKECLALNTSFRKLMPNLLHRLRVVFDCSEFSQEKIDFVRENKLRMKIEDKDEDEDNSATENFFDFTEKNKDLIPYIEILHLDSSDCCVKMQEIFSSCSSLMSYSCNDFENNEITFPDSLICLTINNSLWNPTKLNLPGSMKALKIADPDKKVLLEYRNIEEKDLTTICIGDLNIPIPKGLTTFHTSPRAKEIILPKNIIDFSDHMVYMT